MLVFLDDVAVDPEVNMNDDVVTYNTDKIYNHNITNNGSSIDHVFLATRQPDGRKRDGWIGIRMRVAHNQANHLYSLEPAGATHMQQQQQVPDEFVLHTARTLAAIRVIMSHDGSPGAWPARGSNPLACVVPS